MKKNLSAICIAIVGVLLLTSCERHYYNHHHEHSSRWHNHHRSGVDVNIHT